jgi:hypothetical protein
MLTIKEVANVDKDAAFRQDVQLVHFNDRVLNLGLLRSYLFTASAPGDQNVGNQTISSTGLLERLVDAFLVPRLENRMVAIANYGHGKSHLALAIANYFGRARESEEAQIVLDKLGAALDSPARTSKFRDFKQIRDEFLVLRLHGDDPGSLREQFLTHLEAALAEHGATQDATLPFWFSKAESVLRALAPEQLREANAFLASRRIDVPQLLVRVRAREDVYDLCRDTIGSLHGVKPDLGGEVSLSEAVQWAADEFCGEAKPLGGMLILFDEFGAYIRRYARTSASGDLMDLLNGVECRKGKVVFLSFSQHDPNTEAEGLGLPAVQLGNIIRELNRLPLPTRYVLHTVLESVINAYLRQSKSAWDELGRAPNIRGLLYQATEITYTCFEKRFDRELKWPMEKVQEIVTKGCFPLHPLTTMLLCNLKFGRGEGEGVARTVLGFVLLQLESCRDQPATVKGILNWVLPIKLVDYFDSKIATERYKSYRTALSVGGATINEDQSRLLQSLLLQEAASITAAGREQAAFLAQASGLGDEEARQGLKSLAETNIIRFDPIRRTYTLRPSSDRPDLLENYVRRHTKSAPLDQEDLTTLLDLLRSLPEQHFGSISVPVPWGHPEDWAAKEIVLARPQFTKDQLLELVPFLRPNGNALEGVRGGVVWLISENEEDVAWFRQHAQATLDLAFPGESPLPVVAILGKEPCPDLLTWFGRFASLAEFTVAERELVGQDLYKEESQKAFVGVMKSLISLRGEAANYSDRSREQGCLIVPLAYRATIAALARPSIREVIRECYSIAYRHSPPSFSTQYRVAMQGPNRLREAVKRVANHLWRNDAAGIRGFGEAYPVEKDLSKLHLRDKWHLLASDMRVQVPEAISVRYAWDFLDKAFVADGRSTLVRTALLPLFSMPYGFDYNTATLLFCAWHGFHAVSLAFIVDGRTVADAEIETYLTKSPKDFMVSLCLERPVAVRRRKPGADEREIQLIIVQIAQGPNFQQQDAQDALAKLANFIQRIETGELRQHAEQGQVVLQQALADALEYDNQANRIRSGIQTATSVSGLMGLQDKIGALPSAEVVPPTGPKPGVLRDALLEQLKTMVDAECKRLEALERNTQVDLKEKELHDLRSLLSKHGDAALVARADDALATLKTREQELRAREQEVPVLSQINSIDLSAGLARLLKSRDLLLDMQQLSSKAARARDEKCASVEERIKALEQRANSLTDRASDIASVAALDKWNADLANILALLVDTPFEAQLKRARSEADKGRSFLAEVARIGRMSASSPSEIAKARSDLAGLRVAEYSQLGSAQQDLIGKIESDLAALLEQKSTAAVRQARDVEARIEAGENASSLKLLVDVVPPFLPESELERWLTAQLKIQDLLDNDVTLHIENEFRSIVDRGVRETCLVRLKRILDEG